MPNNMNITHLPTDETLAAGLAGIADALGATVDSAMSDSSENAVQNKVIKAYVDANKGTECFVVTNTFDAANNRVIADKTFGEIKAAADSGKFVIIKTVIEGFVDSVSYLLSCTKSGSTYMICFYGGAAEPQAITGTQNEYPTVSIS